MNANQILEKVYYVKNSKQTPIFHVSSKPKILHKIFLRIAVLLSTDKLKKQQPSIL